MTARCPDPVDAKQTQIITPSPKCLTCGIKFVLTCRVRFLLNMALCIMAKHLCFSLTCSKEIDQESHAVSSDVTLETQLCCHVLFIEKKLFSETLLNKLSLFSVFLSYVTEAFKVYDVLELLGDFCSFTEHCTI